jgi:site-specific recombinase XerD
MNNQPNQTSATEPRPTASQSSDERFKITHWAGKYEGYLFQTSRPATYERYSRALSKFVNHFPHKRFTYEFLRPDLEDYKQARLKDGASATTINIELSILRGFWRWLLAMEAEGVMLNPALGVRVKKPSKRRSVGRHSDESPS